MNTRAKTTKTTTKTTTTPPPATEAPSEVQTLALTLTDAAHLMSVSPATVYRLVSADKSLRTVRIGSAKRILRCDLEAWLAAQVTRQNGDAMSA